MGRRVLLLVALAGLMHAARVLGRDDGPDVLLALGYLSLASVLAGQIAGRSVLAKAAAALLVGFVAGPCGLGLISERAARPLALVGDVAFGIVALGLGSRLEAARVRAMPLPVRTVVLCAVTALGTLVGPLIAAFSRVAPRGTAAFAIAVSGAAAVVAARVHPASVIVMLAGGAWLAAFASASAHALADQIARVRIPLVVWSCALAGAAG